MEKDKAIEQAKTRIADYVNKVTTPSRGKGFYVCPLCKSGTGKNGTGAFSIDSKTNKFKCFACNKSGDVFDLYRLINKVEYLESVKGVCSTLNIPLDEEAPRTTRETYCLDWNDTIGTDKEPKEEESLNLEDYLKTELESENEDKKPLDPEDYEAQFNLWNSELQNNHDYLDSRGISLETANHYNLGHASNWKHPNSQSNYRSERLIIPVDKNNYVARAIGENINKNYRYQKIGGNRLYNIDKAPLRDSSKAVYIVEGELDSISIYEAIKEEAIALGSTSNIRELIERFKLDKPQCFFLMALDNDEVGIKATNELRKELEALEIPYRNVSTELYQDVKDCNEALKKDREAFKEKLLSLSSDRTPKTIEQEFIESRLNHDYLKDFIEYTQTSERKHIPTGFKDLDRILEGGITEGLYSISGGTSTGKTTLVLQIMDNIAKTGQDVIIFSLEMPRNELVARSLSRLTHLYSKVSKLNNTGININKILELNKNMASFTELEKNAFKYAAEEYRKYQKHLFIEEGEIFGDISIEKILDTVKTHARLTGRKPIVVIDYFQIMVVKASMDNPKKLTDKQIADNLIHELKNLSKELSIPVIVVNSHNRSSYQKGVSEASVKESGMIEYTCDVMLGLQYKGEDGEKKGKDKFNLAKAKAKNPRDLELVIVKNRNGESGKKIGFKYKSNFWTFEEVGEVKYEANSIDWESEIEEDE